MIQTKILIGIIAVVLLAGIGVAVKKPNINTFTKAEYKGPTDTETLLSLEKRSVAEENPQKSVEQNKNSGKLSDSGCKTDLFNCYSNFYRELVLGNTVSAAVEDLRVRYNAEPFVKAECHQLTHVIGRAAAEKHVDVSKAFANGDPLCWSGYYHGVMEGIVRKGGKEFTKERLDLICSNIPGKEKYSFDYYNCVHGLGHGIMDLNGNELFASLKACDLLTGSWEQQSCGGGAFMENIIADGKEHVSKYLSKEDLLYPCNAVDQKYKQSCYLMQTSYMLENNGYNFDEVFKLCTKVEEDFMATCFQSLGRDASGNSNSDVNGTITRCELGDNTFQKFNCYIGAVKDFISFYHDTAEAKKLCSSIPTTEIQSGCFQTIDYYYKAFN